MLEQPTAPNVLAVRFSSIGDVLLTTPLLRAIRHRHPASRITVLTKEALVPLLSQNPHLSRVIGMERKHSLTRVASELRGGRYTHLLDLHDSVRSRMLRTLVPGRWTTYPKHRVARALLIYTKRNRYRDTRPVAERYFTAARDLDVVPDGEPPELFLAPEAKRKATDWLRTANLAQDRPMIAIAPGAAHATKRWPLPHWRNLVDRIVAGGFDIAVVGSDDDAALGTALAEGARGRVASAAGVFGLQGTGAVLQRAAALVSGDTGVMHMATAVRTPVVALFGPTVRAFGFFPYTAGADVVELALPCRPCSSKGGPHCPLGHHRCMVEISPDLVHDALRRSIS
ncbi:MAG TPA: lipopolysaccharide heptosyltransferase II [Gemmatimonadales bacterium]